MPGVLPVLTGDAGFLVDHVDGSHVASIVVPDFEEACRDYLAHVDRCDSDSGEPQRHDQYIATIIEQLVRTEAIGTARQRPLRRWIENRLIGDAKRRGETHHWMYDRVSLREKLLRFGFREVHVQEFNTSLVPFWNDLHLDMDKEGNEHRSDSMYVEAVK